MLFSDSPGSSKAAMSDSCCSRQLPGDENGSAAGCAPGTCPACGNEGPSVDHATVAALTRGRVAPKQTFRLCRDRICDLVYHGEQGDRYRVADLHVVPGFKVPGHEALVCYCFVHTRGEIDDELRGSGETTVPDRIAREIQAGNCACEVRNPTGRCCLGELNREVERLRERLAAEVA